MTKIPLSSVLFYFSENSALDGAEFSSLRGADRAIGKAMTGRDPAEMSYDKTEFMLTFDDGKQYAGRLDANASTNLSAHLASYYAYHIGECPEYVDSVLWERQTEELTKFWTEYAV